MRHTTTKALLTLTTIAALAMPGVAQARHGADDPAGHHRHARHHVRHHHTVRHTVRASDDSVTHARGGADDGANHR